MALFDPKKNQISALQKSIEDKNRAISVYYDEIGKLYYAQYRDMSTDVAKDINSRCESISSLYVQIEECRLRILYERGYKECKSCKKENLLEHAYCSACGAKFPESNDVSVVTKVGEDFMAPTVSVAPRTVELDETVEEPETTEETVSESEAEELIPEENEEKITSGGSVDEGDNKEIPQETK